MGEETRKVLLGHRNGDITTHYSGAKLKRLIYAVQRIDASRETPAITLLRTVRSVEGLAEVEQQRKKGRVGPALSDCMCWRARQDSNPRPPGS